MYFTAMPLSCPIVSVLFLLGAPVLGLDSYYPSRFIRRTGHSVAVLGDYLYIDGGELAQTTDDAYGGYDTPRDAWQVNDTISIPLDQSWTNSTVPINIIPKDAPVFDGAALWTEESTNSMYMWGGQGAYGNLTPPTRDLWRFQSNGGAGGAGGWSKQLAANQDMFNYLVRSKEAAATVCNGIGFYIGGYGYNWTDTIFHSLENVPTPGMLTYNMTSRMWANISMDGLNAHGTFMRGTASCLPTFGSQNRGLVLLLGGEDSRRDWYSLWEPSFRGFSNVSFWDMGTNSWNFQVTTGDIPSLRSMFCVVAAAGNNGTYEMFLIGGYDARTETIFEDIYVLSIPGFVWFKANATMGGPRLYEACALAGNRQMLVVGGTRNSNLSIREVDPWPNGIGVFDVSRLSWSNMFDPQAEAYKSPGVVQEWYDAGNQTNVVWSSEITKALFFPKEESPRDPNTDTKNQQADITSASSKIGPIVGGVCGGVVIVVVLGLLLGRHLRRKQLQKKNVAQPPQYFSETNKPVMLATHERQRELNGSEADMLRRSEIPSELPGTPL